MNASPRFFGRCAGPDDAVALLGQPVSHAGRFARVEPWGVEPHVLRWLGTLGLRPDALDRLPDPTAVRAVNGPAVPVRE